MYLCLNMIHTLARTVCSIVLGVSDRLGRRTTMALSIMAMTVGAAVLSVSYFASW